MSENIKVKRMSEKKNIPVIVDGIRTPFMRSHKAYRDLSACDLGSAVLSGIVAKSGIDPELIEYITMGTVIHDPQTPNIARECTLASGLPYRIPAHTVSLACISSNIAMTTISDKIRLGQINIGLAGGVDTCSDPPIRVSKKWRKMLVRFEKVKGMGDFLKELKGLKEFKSLSDFFLDVPKVTEFSNGKSMGQGAEILSQQKQVTREEADLFAERSHRLAVKAISEGIYNKDITPVYTTPKFTAVTKDDGPRGDTTVESLAKLRPAFDKEFGISTAGNSSFLTDGAAALLLMSLAKCEELGMKPQAIVKDYVYAAGNALNEMLSGPVLTIPRLLHKNGLHISDIAVWEIHEAFASQVVANLKFLQDNEFTRTRLKLEAPGEIPLEKINRWGGSLSLGHPFGATGARLLWTAARRLEVERGRYAIVSGCAAGGHGSAILLENPNFER